MEKKQLIKIAIIVIIIMVVLVIIENSIRGIGKFVENKKEENVQEEQIEIYQNSTEYKETVLLEGVIEDVMELLNDNDIDALYNLIDENYKDYKFQNQKELFEEYIKEYVNSEAKISFQTYEKVNEKYVCRLLSEFNGEVKTFIVLINNPEDEENFTIIFDNIYSIEKAEKTVNSKEIKYEFVYKIAAKETLIYTIDFTNLSDKALNYTVTNVTLRDSINNKFEISPENMKISVNPGEKVRYNLEFNDARINGFDEKTLILTFQDENGTEFLKTLYIEDIMEN